LCHTASTVLSPLSLHDALPIWFFAGIAGSVSVEAFDSNTTAFIGANARVNQDATGASALQSVSVAAVNDADVFAIAGATAGAIGDRKSTRLNSSHVSISYAVFC